MLPRPYAVGQNIQHLEHVRPAYQSIGIALDRASKAEGGPASALGSGPKGNPSVLKRLSFKAKPPVLKVAAPTKLFRLRKNA
jgi:hypothetical protein